MLANLKIVDFLERTASKAPVPGGGSMAALSAAASASLSEMVANLTIGKKGFEAIEDDMKEIVENVFNYREKLVQDIDRDAKAYHDVVSAYRLPKGTEKDKKNRNRAIQEALKNAALIPMGVAKDAFKLMELAGKLVETANKNVLTDAGVAAMMARTAVLSALYNVKINLASITDNVFVTDLTKQFEHIEKETEKREKEIMSAIDGLLPKQDFL